MTEILICGSGHQAAVFTACFAEMGHNVRLCGFKEKAVIDEEPGLADLFKKNWRRIHILVRPSALGRNLIDYAFFSEDTILISDSSEDTIRMVALARRFSSLIQGYGGMYTVKVITT